MKTIKLLHILLFLLLTISCKNEEETKQDRLKQELLGIWKPIKGQKDNIEIYEDKGVLFMKFHSTQKSIFVLTYESGVYKAELSLGKLPVFIQKGQLHYANRRFVKG